MYARDRSGLADDPRSMLLLADIEQASDAESRPSADLMIVAEHLNVGSDDRWGFLSLVVQQSAERGMPLEVAVAALREHGFEYAYGCEVVEGRRQERRNEGAELDVETTTDASGFRGSAENRPSTGRRAAQSGLGVSTERNPVLGTIAEFFGVLENSSIRWSRHMGTPSPSA